MVNRREAFISRRKQAGWTHKTLAEHLHVSTSTVSCWERGERTPHPTARTALSEALGVTLGELSHLIDPHSTGVEGHEVPQWFSLYESMIVTYGSLYQVEMIMVPALLQTRDYAMAIEQYGTRQLTEEQIVARVSARMKRQEVLHRELSPINYVCLLSETVLRSRVGGDAIMTDQLAHLADVAQTPNVELRLLLQDGSETVALGNYQLLSRNGDNRPHMLITFDLMRVHYDEESNTVQRFSSTFDYLWTISLSPADTLRYISEQQREKT
jgi:transcriptional regulator with XRE-family HTH domain